MKIIQVDDYDQAMAEIFTEIKRQLQPVNRRRVRRQARRQRRIRNAMKQEI